MKATRTLLTLLALCGTATAASYTVKPGDSLYSIAKKAGVDAPTLMKLNKLPSTTIQVGQTLNLGGTPAPAARPQAAAPTQAPRASASAPPPPATSAPATCSARPAAAPWTAAATP
ncbi:hypothetical protein DEGR_19190 [Deinococcus grandis]|nr:hypothetical protein DEGR_19190 [Deinococcus grandis]